MLFEGITREKRRRSKRTMRLALVADALPGNQALLILLQMAEAKAEETE